METGLAIKLSDDEALVLFEFLASRTDDHLTGPGAHASDIAALDALQCSLEAVLTAPLQAHYAEAVAAAKLRLLPKS